MITMNFKDLKPCSFNGDRYLVSGEGLIWSRRSNKFLKLETCKQGYKKVKLHDNKTIKNFRVHRLVALAFVENPENKSQVNHIDGRKENNHYTNLEWVTPLENTTHAIEKGLHNNKGSSNGSSRFSPEDIKDMKYNPNNLSLKELSDKYNTPKRYICAIRRGERWRHI